MADFIARIKPKKSSVAGEAPLAADLDVAEIAVNTADGKLFVKHTDGSIKEISGSGGGGVTGDGSVRTSAPQVVTAALAQYASEDVTFTQTGRAGQFLKVEASCASWIVFYSSKAARTADAVRTSNENPAQGVGVLMEVFTDQAEAVLITPSVLYFNDDANEGAEIYAKIVNQDAATQAVTVTATVVPIEGRALYEAEGTARIKGLSVETSPIAINTSEFLTLGQTARSGQFTRISTSAAARVIFYSTKAARVADSSRQRGRTPLASSGVLMEVITAGAETLEVTPAILYQNSEPDAAGELYLSVTNLEAAATAITVSVDVVPIEGRGAYLSEFHELLDVDTTGAVDGDGIIYDAAVSKWVPGASSSFSGSYNDLTDVPASSNAVDSVNGETGVVSLGIQEMDDFDAGISLAEGDILQWDNGEQKFKPAQLSAASGIAEAPEDGTPYARQDAAWVSTSSGGGGSSVSDLADLDDVETASPSAGEVLYRDDGEYKHAPVAELLTGRATVTGPLASTVTNDTGMAGTNGFYADNAAMGADGFTFLSGSNNADDAALTIPNAAWSDYENVDYLGQGFSGLSVIRVNTNGSVYLHSSSVGLSGRSGSYVSDHSSVSLVVSWISQDSEVRRLGYKEITQDGTDWFVVRVDMKVPYNNETGGYPLETWFGKDARIRQYFGTKVGTGTDITTGNTHQGVATLGTNLTDVTTITPAGGQRVEYGSTGVVTGFAGAKLEDLSDVGTPADNEFLVYDATSSSWVSTALPASAPVDSVNGATGVVSMGIEDMDDFEKIAQVSSSHRYTLMPDTATGWPAVAAGQYAVAGDGSWLRFNYEDADGNTVAFTASADIWTTTSLAGLWTAGNANTTQDDGVGIRYFFRGAGAAIDADLGATTYLSLIDPVTVTYAPLADGDILQWVDAESKFKPAQLPAVIDKSTLQAEVAAATDFADFQVRIAAL